MEGGWLMSVQNKTYITATELAEMLGISKGHAYKIIRGLNNELKKDGYIVFSGKVPKDYFNKRCYGYGVQ
jgi:hypothetical protein